MGQLWRVLGVGSWIVTASLPAQGWADEPALPCNSLCRRWMGLGDVAEPVVPPPAEAGPALPLAGAVAPGALLQAAPARPPRPAPAVALAAPAAAPLPPRRPVARPVMALNAASRRATLPVPAASQASATTPEASRPTAPTVLAAVPPVPPVAIASPVLAPVSLAPLPPADASAPARLLTPMAPPVSEADIPSLPVVLALPPPVPAAASVIAARRAPAWPPGFDVIASVMLAARPAR